MNNLNYCAHRPEKEMLKSKEGKFFLSHFINSPELKLSYYNYEYSSIQAHVIEEYPIPILVGKNKLGNNNVKTRFIDFVYILKPGDASIFRQECYTIGVEIKTSVRDLYRNPLQINNYFGKTDYMFLTVPLEIINDAKEFVCTEEKLGLFVIETGEIVQFPEMQNVDFAWKEKLLLRALFADPLLPIMQFKPVDYQNTTIGE